jgi:hypothetical protein
VAPDINTTGLFMSGQARCFVQYFAQFLIAEKTLGNIQPNLLDCDGIGIGVVFAFLNNTRFFAYSICQFQ